MAGMKAELATLKAVLAISQKIGSTLPVNQRSFFIPVQQGAFLKVKQLAARIRSQTRCDTMGKASLNKSSS